jgi:hypothetical protein
VSTLAYESVLRLAATSWAVPQPPFFSLTTNARALPAASVV